MKKAIARIVTPTRIVSRVGRRATRTATTRNARAIRAAPTKTAGIGPIITAFGQYVPPGGGVRASVSQAQTLFAATPEPSVDASAHGLYALTLAYGYSPAVLNISRIRLGLLATPV